MSLCDWATHAARVIVSTLSKVCLVITHDNGVLVRRNLMALAAVVWKF